MVYAFIKKDVLQYVRYRKSNMTIKASAAHSAGTEITTKATITGDAGKTVYVLVSGELCDITNLTAKASAGTPSTDPTQAPSENEDKNNVLLYQTKTSFL